MIKLYIQYLIWQSKSMDFDQYEQLIQHNIKQYEKANGKAPNLYKKTKNQIQTYEFYLNDCMAAQSRFEWLRAQKQRLNQIKQSKQIVKDQIKAKQILNELGKDIQSRMDGILADTEKAIQASTYIRIELQKQIKALDNLEDENKQFEKRIKKAKKGLKVIIKRAMMNKVTIALMVLVILAIIGLIVITILKDNGKI